MAKRRTRRSAGGGARRGGGRARAVGGQQEPIPPGLQKAASILDRFSARVAGSFAPIQKVIDKVAATYARVAGSTAKIAASLKSGADALIRAVEKIDKSPALAKLGPAIARAAAKGGGGGQPAGPDFAAAAEVGAVGGVAGGAAKIVAQEAAAFGISRAMGATAASAASVAASAGTTSTAMAATAVPAAATTAATAGTATALTTVLSVVGTVAATLAGVAIVAAAIYATWKLCEAIWPVIKDDVLAVGEKLAGVWEFAKGLLETLSQVVAGALKFVLAVASLANPMTIVRKAWRAIGDAVGWAKDKAVAMAAAIRGGLQAAVAAVAKKWEQFKSLVSATASKISSVAAATANAAATVGGAIKSGFSSALGLVSATAEKIAYAGVALAGIGAAIVGPLTAAGKQFGEAGERAGELAARAGLSTQALTEMGYAAERAGSSSESLASGVASMNATLEAAKAGNADAAKAFEQLGFSVEQIEAMSPEQRFLAMGDAIAQLKSPLDRAAAAQAAFGSAGAGLLPMFDRGAAGIAQMRAEANRLGIVMDGPAAASAKALMDAYGSVKDALRGLWQTLGQAVAPQLIKTAQLTADLVKSAVAWAQANQPLIAQIFRVATVASIAGTAIAAVASSIVPAIPIVAGLAVALLAGGAAWLKYGDAALKIVGSVTGSLKAIYAETTRVLGGIGDAIKGGNLELAVQIAWLGIQAAWAKGLMSLATLTSEGMGGVLSSLAAGDWRGAGEAAWGQVQIVFVEGMSALESLWSQLKSTIDQVVTYVTQAWNTALKAIASQIDVLLGATSNVLAKLAAYDPSGVAAKAAEALNRMGSVGAGVPGSGANADLQSGLDARQKARDESEAQRKQDREDEAADLRRSASLRGAPAGDAAAARMADLQTRLDAALAAAAAARKSAEQKTAEEIRREKEINRGAEAGAAGGGGGGATFSAAGLMAMGGRGNAQERLVAGQQQQLAKLDRQIAVLEKIEKAVDIQFVA